MLSFVRLFRSVLTVVVVAAAARAEDVSPDAGRALERPIVPGGATETVTEHPYKVGERPHADGAVEASVADETIMRWNVGGSSNPACPSNRAGFHPAPRVKVDTLVLSGRLPPRSTAKDELSKVGVLTQTRNRGYWPFRLCFEAGLRRDATLAGKTRVRISIGRNGRVSSSRLGQTELGDSEVSTCLATRARALRFQPPPRRADVEVTIDLAPGDAPLPDGVGKRQTTPLDPGPGRLDVRRVEAALSDKVPSIIKCFGDGRARDPALWGRVALRFEADAAGAVQNVVEHDSRFPDPSVVSCMLSAARGAALGPVQGGPLRFVWAVRFGAGPSTEVAGNQPSSNAGKSRVADSPSPRVRLAQ